MIITFNLINCGLGNNGGSITVVKSANVLSSLGHDVKVIDSMKNMHTWNKLKVPHIQISDLSQFPKSDFVIATGYKTVKSTVVLPSKCGKKIHWIRGWETWQMNESDIITKVLQQPTIKITNGLSLKNKLKEYGIDSTIIRPGIDDDIYFEKNVRNNNQNYVFGGLYHSKHKTKNTKLIFDIIYHLKKINSKIKLLMFGVDKKPILPENIVDKYICQPSNEQKNDLYNMCDIWLAPTVNDSLHIPPMEALLTGCSVMVMNHHLNGMWDYINPDYFVVVSQSETPEYIAKKLLNFLNNSKHDRKQRKYIIKKIGNRVVNMQKIISFLKDLS